MKTITNETELIALIENDYYYYKGMCFENGTELTNACEDYFKSITEDYDDVENYYQTFGGVTLEKVKIEMYFNEENNTTCTVHFFEGYIDSGVPAEDYFYGFTITEN